MYKPEPGTISQKPQAFGHKLRSNVTQTEYRAWKFEAIAFCNMCEQIRYSDANVRAALFSALEENLGREYYSVVIEI